MVESISDYRPPTSVDPKMTRPPALARFRSAFRFAGILGIGAVLVFTLALSAMAQEVYIWEDDDGIRHLSDRRPEGDYEVRVQRAIAQPEAPVEMTNVGSQREPEWRFTNRMHGPVTIAVGLRDSSNVVTDPPLPARIELPAADHRSVVIGPLDPRAGWRYSIEMAAIPGPLDPDIDNDHRYRVPLAPDQPLHIGQGFGGRFSHDLPHSRYAVDFALPVGTPVHAARAGTVMDIERYFHRAGRDPERDGPRANYVRILHNDGSMAVYAHLDYNAVRVRPGERVEVGQELGRSGNTGFSTGPHLHFAVQVNRGMRLVSVPFRMDDHKGRAIYTGSSN